MPDKRTALVMQTGFSSDLNLRDFALSVFF